LHQPRALYPPVLPRKAEGEVEELDNEQRDCSREQQPRWPGTVETE
jgi:hypothetical protein